MIAKEHMQNFRDTLLTGGYNLLFGSGISLDSQNKFGHCLRGTEKLRTDLCKLTGANRNTSLTRVYGLLKPEQVKSEIVEKYSHCRPGSTLKYLPHFLWRRLFTFNVDDVIEELYHNTSNIKQDIIPLNFNSSFEPTPEKNEIQTIHLHGWVKQPESGFVFSSSEYVRVMREINPWMHLLSEIIATESFIIAGTSLNEIDLEYYLNHRNQVTPRRGRGPSFFITPDPDGATLSDCERFGLILIKSKFGEFLKWLKSQYPTTPTVYDLVVPSSAELFSESINKVQLLKFFSDFELITATDQPLSSLPSSFLYGGEPSWPDIHQHVDIERKDNEKISQKLLETSLENVKDRFILVLDEAGTGKTTTIKRIAHNLAKSGNPVLSLRTLSRINTDAAIACLACAKTNILLVIDHLADHIDQLMQILDNKVVAQKVIILAAERSYRKEYLDIVRGEHPIAEIKLLPMQRSVILQLIERYNKYGLVANARAVKKPSDFANQLLNDPIAISVCRILNDFQPIAKIIDSLWEATKQTDRLPYLCVALAQHCYGAGFRYSLLQNILGPNISVSRFINSKLPLMLGINSIEEEFLVTANQVIGERILNKVIFEDKALLYETFRSLAIVIAPHVNRKAVMKRTPEARLAGRLFDSDKIVRPFLGNESAEKFYNVIQSRWQWNSRYWEQRALLAADNDLNRAIQYARHAVANERHPFPLTTLGKILLMNMKNQSTNRSKLFSDAFMALNEAIEMEASNYRISAHPYATLLSGTVSYLDLGGELTRSQKRKISEYRNEAAYRFRTDTTIATLAQQLDSKLD